MINIYLLSLPWSRSLGVKLFLSASGIQKNLGNIFSKCDYLENATIQHHRETHLTVDKEGDHSEIRKSIFF